MLFSFSFLVFSSDLDVGYIVFCPLKVIILFFPLSDKYLSALYQDKHMCIWDITCDFETWKFYVRNSY